jgi:hypothetical protein
MSVAQLFLSRETILPLYNPEMSAKIGGYS